MRKIIVHTGYVPYDILQKSRTLAPKGAPIQFVMMMPETAIVDSTNELLNSINDKDVVEIATNNIITVYAIRAYVVKHANNYNVEYRYYTEADFKSNDSSQYKLIKQGENGQFIDAPEGFFDTINNLIDQILGLD